jgi:hypothetical protein
MMKFPASLFPSQPRHHKKAKLPLCQQDLIMFQALTGRSADLPTPQMEERSETSGLAPIKTIAKRWKPNVAQITGRLRSIYAQGAGPKRQQMTDWLKRLSEHASNRLDEAQARLNAARIGPIGKQRRGQVILTLHPKDVTVPPQNAAPADDDYKRVA